MNKEKMGELTFWAGLILTGINLVLAAATSPLFSIWLILELSRRF